MAFRCPECGEAIPPENINVAADLAKCAACGEVFRPSGALGARTAPAPEGGPLPPVPPGPPEGTRVAVDQTAGGISIRLPPRGFGADTVFLTAFAIAWWSFLLTFVGVGGLGPARHGEGDAPPPGRGTEKPPPSAAPAGAPGDKRPAEDTRRNGLPVPKGVFPVFILLFLTPFFLAGFAMIGGILWPLFGRVEVSVDGQECAHRASLFGLGRTHRASIEHARLRWRSEAADAGAGLPSFVRRMQPGADSPILLSLGAWDTKLGGHLSRAEQEWVFHALHQALARARGAEERKRGPSLS